MPAEKPTDEELLALMIAGDEQAFTALYRRRHAAVYRFAMQMSGAAEIAEDVTQEVFLMLIRDAARYDHTRGTLVSFLYGVARNHLRRLAEKSRPLIQLPESEEDGAAPEGIGDRRDLLADLAREQMIGRLRQCVLALPVHYREAVVLCDLHEMSYAEAAAVLDCAVGTVRSRLHRARGILIARLRTEAAPGASSDADGAYARCLA